MEIVELCKTVCWTCFLSVKCGDLVQSVCQVHWITKQLSEQMFNSMLPQNMKKCDKNIYAIMELSLSMLMNLNAVKTVDRNYIYHLISNISNSQTISLHTMMCKNFSVIMASLNRQNFCHLLIPQYWCRIFLWTCRVSEYIFSFQHDATSKKANGKFDRTAVDPGNHE